MGSGDLVSALLPVASNVFHGRLLVKVRLTCSSSSPLISNGFLHNQKGTKSDMIKKVSVKRTLVISLRNKLSMSSRERKTEKEHEERLKAKWIMQKRPCELSNAPIDKEKRRQQERK